MATKTELRTARKLLRAYADRFEADGGESTYDADNLRAACRAPNMSSYSDLWREPMPRAHYLHVDADGNRDPACEQNICQPCDAANAELEDAWLMMEQACIDAGR